MPALVDFAILGSPLWAWLAAAAIAAVLTAALIAARGIVARRLAVFAAATETKVDDVIAELVGATHAVFLAVLGLLGGSLALTEAVRAPLARLAVVALLVQAGLWGRRAIAFAVASHAKRNAVQDPGSVMSVRALAFGGTIALWTLVLLITLSNIGVDVTALVAGLGVGGIAIALAVQSILGDLFASLSIVLDRPFVQGDFIIVGDFMGVVDHVGLKTTRVRSLGGEQIVFSNADLLQSRIRNYKRMAERRVLFTVGVTYDTPQEALVEIPEMLRQAVASQPRARLDRAHWRGFGASSLDFEVVYYVLDPDYNLYMDIQQAINFDILRRFTARGIAFALPTQTLELRRSARAHDAARAPARRPREHARESGAGDAR